MTTQTLRNGQSVDIDVPSGQSLGVVAVSGTYNASIISGAGIGAIATAATGGTYGPYTGGGAEIRLTASATSEIDFEVAVTPAIESDTVARLAVNPLNGGVIGLVAPDGSVISFAGPSYTYSGLPAAAAGNAGMSARVTDIGPVGAGSVWMSDGTRWRPIGGEQLHCANTTGTIAAPLVTVSAAAGKLALPAGDRVTAGSILLPIGTPQIGQGVRVSAKMYHRGTGGAWAVAARIGSLDTSSDPSFATSTGTAADAQGVWLLQEMEVVSATSFMASTFATPNNAGTGAMVLRNTNFNNAAQLYLSFYVTTLNAADSVDLLSYRVELVG